jgi:hypothetical protein
VRGLLLGLLIGVGAGYGLAQWRAASRAEPPGEQELVDVSTGDWPEEWYRLNEPPDERMGYLLLRDDGSGLLDDRVAVFGEAFWEESGYAHATEIGEGAQRYRLWPGTYRLCWGTNDEEDRWTPVEIRKGETTTVSLRDLSRTDRDPVPPERARLRVTVHALDGTPLPGATVEIWVGVIDTMTRREFRAGARGTLAGDVPPTLALVRVGARRHGVELSAGHETRVEFRYESEGELILRDVPYGHPELRPPGGRPPPTPIGSLTMLEAPVRIAYVPPGDYELWWRFEDEEEAHFVQNLTIESRRATELRPSFPKGELELTLDWGRMVSEARIELTRLDADAPARTRALGMSTPGGGAVLDFRYLPAGAWRLRITARGYRNLEDQLTIGQELVSRQFRLRMQ